MNFQTEIADETREISLGYPLPEEAESLSDRTYDFRPRLLGVSPKVYEHCIYNNEVYVARSADGIIGSLRCIFRKDHSTIELGSIWSVQKGVISQIMHRILLRRVFPDKPYLL
jgi:hypothetical protein